MYNQKIENQLNLSLDVPIRQREKSINLSTGYDEITNTWELLVRFNGDLSVLKDDIISAEILTNDYAVIVVPENKVDKIATYTEIEYIEKPKVLNFILDKATRAACIKQVQESFPELTGKGVIIGVIDSGIDYFHPDFRNEDGTTRIISILDLSETGAEPGRVKGVEYTRDEINFALQQDTRQEALEIVPSTDIIGHGTHVAGIAGGNGRASDGEYRGVAYESDFIIVKLGQRGGEPLYKSTEIMRGLVYIINKAQELNQPVAINISFGNNYGSHDGSSLFETFMDSMTNQWKNVIVVGSGNEGAAAHHYSNIIEEGEEQVIEFTIAPFEIDLSLQLWKSYSDDFLIEIEGPTGQKSGFIKPLLGTQEFIISNTRIYLYFGEPSPYNTDQEIYIEFLPYNKYLSTGIWKIRIKAEDVVIGEYDLWLPTATGLNPNTKFLQPDALRTLTLPSTSTKVITVGAYNSQIDSIAPFSGRGYTRVANLVKPDLVAPGVDITSTVPGGGYDSFSGTSMATPFVTGASALLMEWGIVRGNDPFLYGEKIKAYLRKSAKRKEEIREYPNPQWGYGALCLANVFR